MQQYLEIKPPVHLADARAKTIRSRGSLRLTIRADQPVVELAAVNAIPWRGGLTAVMAMAAELFDNALSYSPRASLRAFDDRWNTRGGVVSAVFDVSGDELFGWSLSFAKLHVPNGWQCDVCGNDVTYAEHSISNLAVLPSRDWTTTNIHPLELHPATVCSAKCLKAAVRQSEAAERCQGAELLKIKQARKLLTTVGL